jgi:signal transduction histidine kinase
VVRLVYPVSEDGLVRLEIEDDGRGDIPTPQPGHWGVSNMRESASAIGGSLSFRQTDRGGLIVVVSFAARNEFATSRGKMMEG